MNDAVRINVECDFNLRNTFGRRRDADEVEVTEELVVADELTLSLEDLDFNSGLTIGSSRERLRLLGGDGRVAGDELGHNTTKSLNTEGERCDVRQKNVPNVTRQDSTLNSRANGNGFVGVDALIGLATKDTLDGVNDLGHTAHTTNEDDFIDIARLQTGIVEGLLAGIDSALNNRVDEGLELGTEELEVDVFGTRRIHANEGEVDLGLSGGQQLDLGLLGGLTNMLNSHSVTGEIDTSVLLEIGENMLDKSNIEVLTTKVSISVGGLDFEYAALEFEDRDIKGSAAQVVDSHNVFTGLVHTVSKGGSSGFIDDAKDAKTSNLSGIFGCLPLGVVEVGRDSDEGMLDLLFDHRRRWYGCYFWELSKDGLEGTKSGLNTCPRSAEAGGEEGDGGGVSILERRMGMTCVTLCCRI